MMVEVLGRLIVPSGLILVFLALGILLFVISRRRLACGSALIALAIYIVFGSGVVAHALLGPLEREQAPVTDAAALGDVDVIIVLTGYASAVEDVAPAGWLNDSSAYRVLEAMWLKAQLSDSRVLVSGTPGSAETLVQVFVSLGLGEDGVFVDA